MSRALIELLEPRSLLTTLTPDLTYATDGAIARAAKKISQTYYFNFIGQAATGLLINQNYYDGTRPNQSLVRYNLDGTADESYVSAVPPDGLDGASGVDATGRVLYLTETADNVVAITRYAVNGGIDPTFGKSGVASVTLPTLPGDTGVAYGEHPAVVPAPDGSMFVMAAAENYGPDHADTKGREIYLFRLDARGRYDATFGTALVAKVGDDGFKLMVDANGRAVVSSSDPRRHRFNVVRYAANGTLDASFARGGVYRISGFPSTDFYSATLDRQGRMLITRVAPKAAVTRLTLRGRVDSTFGTNGTATDFAAANGTERVADTFVAADGTVSVLFTATGGDDQGQFIVRLNEDGTPDTTLGTNGLATVLKAGRNDPGIATLLPDGNYLLALSYGTFGLTKFAPATPFALGTSGTLTFYYLPDSGNETITVTRSNGRDRVTFNGQTTTYAAGSIKSIDASLGDGTNQFTSTLDVPTTVNGGLGADYITTGDARDLIRLDPNDYTTDAPDGYALVNTGGGYDVIVPGPPGRHGYDINLGTGGGLLYGNYSTLGKTTVTGSGRGKWNLAASGKTFTVTLTGSGESADIDGGGAASSRIDLSGFTGVTNVIGTRGDDVITTGPGADNVAPLGGSDTVATGAGNDTVYGDFNDDNGEYNAFNVADGSGLDDSIDAGSGNDLVHDFYGNNTLLGNAGNDRLSTGDGRDRVEGGSGNDLIAGGPGPDTLHGNAGRDTIYAGNAASRKLNETINSIDGGGGDDILRVESEGDDFESIERVIGLG